MSQDSTALAVVDTATSALASFGINEGEPMKPSNLVLVQKADEDNPGLVPGKFVDMQSNMSYDFLNIVPISMGYPRTLFPDDTLGVKPLCRSNDGVMPVISDDYVRQDGGLGCAKCSKSQWVRVNGKLIKPECQDNIRFLFAELETGFIFRYNAKRMTLAPVKDLKETLRKLVVRLRVPTFGLTFKLTSQKVKGQKGSYYLPKFTPTGQVNPADIGVFQNIYEYFEAYKNKEKDGDAADPVSKVLDGEYQTYEAA